VLDRIYDADATLGVRVKRFIDRHLTPGCEATLALSRHRCRGVRLRKQARLYRLQKRNFLRLRRGAGRASPWRAYAVVWTLAKTRRMIQRLPRPYQELPFASHKLGPFACKAEQEQPVALGPCDAGKSATNIGLLAQILTVCKLPMHRRASHIHRHADTLHPIIPPVVARQPLSCAGTRATGSAFCRARLCAREARAIARSGAGVALVPETVGVFGA
jgi:hypothetical protein